MLAVLRVRDLVLIEALDLELHRGFNVLTGETGAGKSVLVTAIGLVLGARAKANLVRSGAETAEVEALFDISDEPEAQARLLAAGWPADEELLVRRVISAQGRSRCFVNGHPVPLSMLAELSAGLAELSSQHEHHALADAGTHLYSLDAFAKLVPGREAVAATYEEVMAASRELERLLSLESERAHRIELLRFQLDQLDELAPEAGEEEALRQERGLLRASTSLIEAASLGERELYSADGAVTEVLTQVIERIRQAASVDATLLELTAQLEEAQALLEDSADQMRRYADRFDVEPGRLEHIEERLAAYHKLHRVVEPSGSDLFERWEAVRAELASLDAHDDLVEQAKGALKRAIERSGALAKKLSARRKTAARKLARAFITELKDLGMGQASIEVRVEAAKGGEPSIEGARLTETGVDQVEFLIAPNPGEPAGPLRSIASGGELSRAALALKRALAGVGPVGTYVFDEADAGISGAVADMVGRKLREVAGHHQVVCVTHLPQVAALADSHFEVRKRQVKKRTVTAIEGLDEAGRIEAIAAMLSGSTVTEKARAAAAELIASR